MPHMTSRQIDSLCDDFEAALRRGDTTLIEDFLPQVEETERTALLKELLEVEIQFAAERCPKESAEFLRNTQESLKRRFPEHHELIQSLFREFVQLRQIGDYEIIGELGRGGMGIVYKAKHKLLQQTVAVKVLSQALLDDTQAVGRFRREMQLIGSLVHPNVVRALNAGETEGTHYLAMEFVDGISLHKLVESVREKNDKQKTEGLHPPLIPLGAACEAIRQAALGLQNAHELKLVHRDIKPANLMLDHRGTVKILDLGLGKFAEEHRSEHHSSLTMEGMVVGTVDYISPEQCENSREADIRSDLYSLGCTFYFLLTGKPVYSGSRYDTMRKKLMAHIVGEVPSLRQTIPNLPIAVEKILQKVLAKDPAERYQTPIEFAEALAPFASFDELWTLVGEAIPSDGSGVRSTTWHSSTPHTGFQSMQRNVPPPASRLKRIIFFVGLNLLICSVICAVFFLLVRYPSQRATMLAQAMSAESTAKRFRAEWKMTEAREEFQKAVLITAEMLLKQRDDRIALRRHLHNRLEVTSTQWYQGDSRVAGRNLDSILDFMNNLKWDEQLQPELDDIRKIIHERRGDFGLFGGAASGVNVDRFENRMARYNDALRLGTDDFRNKIIRWKQAILRALNGELEEAEKLLRDNPPLPDEKDSLYIYTHQLAEAVVFYYQQNGAANREEKLRSFQRQFTLRSNALGTEAMRPEILDLLIFSSEFLISDSIRNEDWGRLSDDLLSNTNATGNFLRQYPGATPFLRRYYELLVRSAVLLHDHAEQQRDKQRHIDNIVRLLERMRLIESDMTEREKPTWVYFFLPESNRPEEGFVLFYPQDGRDRVLYPLALTRPMVKQPDGRTFPSLPSELLHLAGTPGSSLRISWEDVAAWARTDDALTEADYPYDDVLSLGR